MRRNANRQSLMYRTNPSILPQEFYTRNDVVTVARELLGKILCTRIRGGRAKAIIAETEAYAGVDDRASHAFGGKRTARTEPMFGAGGIAYVYLCYGIHHLFNVVTNIEGTPHAVLIRAAIPLAGEKLMLRRRGRKEVDEALMKGPGTLSQALGITTRLTGTSLQGDRIWIEDQSMAPTAILTGPRIGVGYAGKDAALPYRFIARFE
jgi:DNA-3-methyladenine glycosylase